ncbi:hypothetical protein H671_6g16923 [Cricetulus griseus]|nr:hypothetical protein H671_6g16923 [Cricetulus griseus]
MDIKDQGAQMEPLLPTYWLKPLQRSPPLSYLVLIHFFPVLHPQTVRKLSPVPMGSRLFPTFSSSGSVYLVLF